MVQKLFSLYTQPEESHQLHVEVGKAHVTCWCTGDDHAFTALEYFTYTYDNTEGGFVDVFRELKRRSILLSNAFTSPQIVWENADFVCVPNELFKAEQSDAYLKLVNSPAFLSAAMYRPLPDYMLLFAADPVLYKIVTQQLPGASHTHKMYTLLQRGNEGTSNSLYLQFYSSHFLLTAVKAGELQLATFFSFTTPGEAVYHILNTMDKLSLNKDETITFLSGFIDESSPLYKEIYQYVAHLQFTQSGRINDEHPAHYFTTYNLPTA